MLANTKPISLGSICASRLHMSISSDSVETVFLPFSLSRERNMAQPDDLNLSAPETTWKLHSGPMDNVRVPKLPQNKRKQRSRDPGLRVRFSSRTLEIANPVSESGLSHPSSSSDVYASKFFQQHKRSPHVQS